MHLQDIYPNVQEGNLKIGGSSHIFLMFPYPPIHSPLQIRFYYLIWLLSLATSSSAVLSLLL
jgi:hypothetical protein